MMLLSVACGTVRYTKSQSLPAADSPLVPHQGLWYSVRPMPNKLIQRDFQIWRGFCKKPAKAAPALKAPDEGVMRLLNFSV